MGRLTTNLGVFLMASTVSRPTMAFLIIFVLAGLVVAYGVRMMLTPEAEAPPPAEAAAPPMMKVPVAVTDLPADRLVTGNDFTVMSLTAQQFKERFKGIEADQIILSTQNILHRRLREPIKRLQPFIATKFYLDGMGPSIAKKLQPGYRAIRVQVPQAREGGVLIGMSVDVMFRAKAQPAKKDQLAIPEKTLTLLRHVDVINIERPNSRSQGRDSLLYTLAVPESKVDMFSIIEGRGDLWLVPMPTKGQENAVAANTEVANAETLAGLLGIKAPQPAPPPFQTEIYERGRRTVNTFVDGRLASNHVNAQQSQIMLDRPEPSSTIAPPPAPVNTALPTAPPAPEKDE
jgi:Flp pilus assembly protein CpaB